MVSGGGRSSGESGGREKDYKGRKENSPPLLLTRTLLRTEEADIELEIFEGSPRTEANVGFSLSLLVAVLGGKKELDGWKMR